VKLLKLSGITMGPAIPFRALVNRLAPEPVTRLMRSILRWKRSAPFRPYNVTKTVLGESFPFCIGDETGETWYGPQKDPVYQELAFIRDRMLAPRDLVFDVGSHHGLHTICMARHSARVVAIEPNPHNVTILQKNVVLNALQNVVLRQAAVGDSQGTIDLLEDSTEGGVSYEHGTDNQATIVSELVSLDQIAHEYGFPQLLKIDVEGFEDRALKGATQILQRRPKIAIEVHTEWVSRYGSSVAEVIALLNLKDYRVWILPYTAEEVLAWDGRDFSEYPPPKFMLFLMPLVASERPAA